MGGGLTARTGLKTIFTPNDGEAIVGMIRDDSGDCIYVATTGGVYVINNEYVVTSVLPE